MTAVKVYTEMDITYNKDNMNNLREYIVELINDHRNHKIPNNEVKIQIQLIGAYIASVYADMANYGTRQNAELTEGHEKAAL